jgi:hypothetical protein
MSIGMFGTHGRYDPKSGSYVATRQTPTHFSKVQLPPWMNTEGTLNPFSEEVMAKKMLDAQLQASRPKGTSTGGRMGSEGTRERDQNRRQMQQNNPWERRREQGLQREFERERLKMQNEQALQMKKSFLEMLTGSLGGMKDRTTTRDTIFDNAGAPQVLPLKTTESVGIQDLLAMFSGMMR